MVAGERKKARVQDQAKIERSFPLNHTRSTIRRKEVEEVASAQLSWRNLLGGKETGTGKAWLYKRQDTAWKDLRNSLRGRKRQQKSHKADYLRRGSNC